MELGPTLCELAGVPQIPEADGISLCPQLQEGKEDLERMAYAAYLNELYFDTMWAYDPWPYGWGYYGHHHHHRPGPPPPPPRGHRPPPPPRR